MELEKKYQEERSQINEVLKKIFEKLTILDQEFKTEENTNLKYGVCRDLEYIKDLLENVNNFMG